MSTMLANNWFHFIYMDAILFGMLFLSFWWRRRALNCFIFFLYKSKHQSLAIFIVGIIFRSGISRGHRCGVKYFFDLGVEGALFVGLKPLPASRHQTQVKTVLLALLLQPFPWGQPDGPAIEIKALSRQLPCIVHYDIICVKQSGKTPIDEIWRSWYIAENETQTKLFALHTFTSNLTLG